MPNMEKSPPYLTSEQLLGSPFRLASSSSEKSHRVYSRRRSASSRILRDGDDFSVGNLKGNKNAGRFSSNSERNLRALQFREDGSYYDVRKFASSRSSRHLPDLLKDDEDNPYKSGEFRAALATRKQVNPGTGPVKASSPGRSHSSEETIDCDGGATGASCGKMVRFTSPKSPNMSSVEDTSVVATLHIPRPEGASDRTVSMSMCASCGVFHEGEGGKSINVEMAAQEWIRLKSPLTFGINTWRKCVVYVSFVTSKPLLNWSRGRVSHTAVITAVEEGKIVKIHGAVYYTLDIISEGKFFPIGIDTDENRTIWHNEIKRALHR